MSYSSRLGSHWSFACELYILLYDLNFQMNDLIISNIKTKVFTLRGVQVMLDTDLADLYGVKAIRLREQVKRNVERFPDDFRFQLTEDEVNFMLSQNAIPSKKQLGGNLPYAFTEQGVSMLSGVLRSKSAIQVSINVINAFVAMRKFISQMLLFLIVLIMLRKNKLVLK